MSEKGRASLASSSALRLRELTLAGFGIYRAPTRFLFPEGNALYFGPNETGKSTLAFGLAAAWFGLPSTSDPSRIGTARFRSFGSSGAFFGELVWERSGRRYRLHRDFETHRVRLTEESTGQIDLLFEGEHNPLGRSSAGSAFPPVLSELLGFASWDLFLQTFCISQPLPHGAQIGSELQHLLSGSQNARIDEVRERIFQRIKELTKSTGELGLARPGSVRPTNQRDQGRVEELESRVAKVRLQVEHGRIQLERLNQGNDAIEHAQAEQQILRERREERRRRCRTLDAWSERQQERMRRSAAVQLLRNAANAIEETAQERAALQAKLSEETDGLDAPIAAESKLEALERAARDHAREAEAEERLAEERREREAQRESLLARLEAYSDVRGRTDWAEAHASLARAVTRRAELERDLRDMRARLEAADRPTQPMSVEAARLRATHYLEAISRLEAIEARSSEIRAQLEEREYLQEDDRLELLKEKFRLENELKECSASLRQERARDEAVRRELDRSVTPRPTNRRSFAGIHWIGAIGWTALAAGVSLGIGLSLGLSLLVSIGSGALLFAILRSRRGARAELAHVAPSAGVTTEGHAKSDGVANAADLARVGDAAKSDAPTPETPTATQDSAPQPASQLRLTQRKLEDRLHTISLELGPYANATSNEISRMEGRWQALDEEAEALAAEQRTLRPRLAIPPDSQEDWRDETIPPEMLPLLELPGAPDDRSHRAMAAWLRALDEDAWQRFFEQERLGQDSAREWISLEDRISARTAELEDRTEIEILEARLHPFTLDDDPELLARRSADAAQLERQLDLLRDRSPESPDSRSQTSNAVLVQCWNELIRIWPTAPEQAPWIPGQPDPNAHGKVSSPAQQVSTSQPRAIRPEIELAGWAAETRRRLRVAAPVTARIEALAESEAKILATENCTSRIDLEQRLAAEESALGAVVRELELLARNEILLGGADDADPESREQRLDALLARMKNDEESDQSQEQILEAKIRDLHRKQAALEGEATPNVAALEIELRCLESELEQSKQERDALAMAHRWMEEALRAYQETHRVHLAEQIGHHFQVLSGVPRRVLLDERFEISVLERTGHPMCLDQLSQGARDQLLLAIRLAVADLLSSNTPIPFLLDDPFVHFDAQRLELVREALNRLGRRRQWVLLTHRRELATWADPIFVEESKAVSGEAAISAQRHD